MITQERLSVGCPFCEVPCGNDYCPYKEDFDASANSNHSGSTDGDECEDGRAPQPTGDREGLAECAKESLDDCAEGN